MKIRRLNRAVVLKLVASIAVCVAFVSLYLRAEPRNAPERSASSAAPTFYRDVAPVLQKHCETCHRADGIAPMALQNYAQAKKYAPGIAASVQSKTMPPWFAVAGIGHFSNDPSLTTEQIGTLATWAAAGAPAGEVKDAPAPIHWAESWTIAQPDLVLPMTRGVEIPADGDVDYT